MYCWKINDGVSDSLFLVNYSLGISYPMNFEIRWSNLHYLHQDTMMTVRCNLTDVGVWHQWRYYSSSGPSAVGCVGLARQIPNLELFRQAISCNGGLRIRTIPYWYVKNSESSKTKITLFKDVSHVRRFSLVVYSYNTYWFDILVWGRDTTRPLISETYLFVNRSWYVVTASRSISGDQKPGTIAR